jgi:hypothetical protein
VGWRACSAPMAGCQPRFAGMRWDGTDTGDRSLTSTCAARIRALATDSDSRRLLPHPKGLRVDAEHRPASAIGSISNIAHAAYPGLPCSCRIATRWGQRGRGGARLKIDVERIVDSIRAALSPREQRIGQVGQVRRVITAGHRWCPRQDSNLRSRLRRPVDLVIPDASWRPTWPFSSRPVLHSQIFVPLIGSAR